MALKLLNARVETVTIELPRLKAQEQGGTLRINGKGVIEQTFNRFLVNGGDECRVERAEERSAETPVVWPEGKKFAFTIIDDTDVSTVRTTKPLYDLLAENGLSTTKTVWPLQPAENSVTGGDSLEDPEYRQWVLDLKERGFEIALHGVSDGSSSRERVIQGMDRFRDTLGSDSPIYVNHVGQAEAIYWGPARFDPPVRWIYQAYRKSRHSQAFEGMDQSSPYFWGDICQKRTKYVRNFVFSDINTLKMDPLMPYHDARRPFVHYWFSSSYGSNSEAFCQLLSEENQDRLVEEGGACIVYAHFGTFHPLGARFKALVRRIAKLPGWFPTASRLLDFLGTRRGWRDAENHKMALQRMQWKWLLDQTVRNARERSGRMLK